MALNGKVKAIASALPPTAMIAILGFMGKGIVDNDRTNTQQHIEIRKEMIAGDAIVKEKVDDVKDIVTDIRLEQRSIIETLKRIEHK